MEKAKRSVVPYSGNPLNKALPEYMGCFAMLSMRPKGVPFSGTDACHPERNAVERRICNLKGVIPAGAFTFGRLFIRGKSIKFHNSLSLTEARNLKAYKITFQRLIRTHTQRVRSRTKNAPHPFTP